MIVYRKDEAPPQEPAPPPPVPLEPLAVPEPEAARVLGIGYRTLFDLRKANKGPKFVRIGKSVRYPVHLLREWLTDQAEGGAA